MSRRIQHVRKAIKQRKKHREHWDGAKNTHKNANPILLSEEEKHGYVPSYYESDVPLKWNKNHILPSNVAIKAFISILLFVGMAFMLGNSGDRFPTTQQWLTSQLQEEFPFAKVNDWYVTTLGSPLALTPQGNIPVTDHQQATALPVLGHVVETFATNGTGIMISPEERSMVTTVDRGVVVFAGNDQKTKKTIIVQHADDSYTTYGFLGSIDVHLYQIVEPNQTIGSFTPTTDSEVVYFSVEKDNQFIDPSQVIPVDDIP
jgi:stage IV sporulation protein FA